MTDSLTLLMTDWLFAHKRKQVASGTFEKLVRCAKLYIFPLLGETPISEISSENIQYLITESLYEEKNLTFATVHKCKCLLNNFFDYCLKADIVQNNPVKNTVGKMQIEGQINKSTKTYEKDDYIKVIDAISASRFWKPFCLTAMHTDIRLNEILALKWHDIDLQNKTIHIHSVVIPTTNGAYGISEYRTPQAHRVLPITKYLCDVLQTHKNFREREQRHIRNKYSYVDNDDFVFGNEMGNLRSYSGLSHNFRKFLKSQGLDSLKITLHSLRQFVKEQQKKRSQDELASIIDGFEM